MFSMIWLVVGGVGGYYLCNTLQGAGTTPTPAGLLIAIRPQYIRVSQSHAALLPGTRVLRI